MIAPARTLERVKRADPTLRYELSWPEAPVGAVVLTHGYAEHSGRYLEVVEALVARRLAVLRYDLRGHGYSQGTRGHIQSFDDYLQDLDELRQELSKEESWRSLGTPVLLGHSLGGLISFHAALRDPGSVRGVVLSSPFFGVALHVSAPKRIAATYLSRLIPTFALPSGLQGADLTHDPERARAYDEDPLLIKKATARFFTEALRAHAQALELAPQVHWPLSIYAGGADKVASVEATKAVYARVPEGKKALQVLEGEYHEIFNELERGKWIPMVTDAVAAMLRPSHQ